MAEDGWPPVRLLGCRERGGRHLGRDRLGERVVMEITSGDCRASGGTGALSEGVSSSQEKGCLPQSQAPPKLWG